MIKILKTEAYIIRAITNMHPGSGDSTFGVVDNLVQRDPITDFPTINSSSLKGAIREYFENNDFPKDDLTFIFGSEAKADKDNKKAGAYSFLNADLLVFPVRSNCKPFFRATCPELLNSFRNKWNLVSANKASETKEYKAIETLAQIDVKDGKPLVFENFKEVILEDFDAVVSDDMDGDTYKILGEILGDSIALFSNTDFQEIAGKERIPTIARNYLENGESKNLWYEEILPRETRFVTLISKPVKYAEKGVEKTNLADINKRFEKMIKDNTVQIGANASIGYGVSEFTKLQKDT